MSAGPELQPTDDFPPTDYLSPNILFQMYRGTERIVNAHKPKTLQLPIHPSINPTVQVFSTRLFAGSFPIYFSH